jgi:hypothetical protein
MSGRIGILGGLLINARMNIGLRGSLRTIHDYMCRSVRILQASCYEGAMGGPFGRKNSDPQSLLRCRAEVEMSPWEHITRSGITSLA